MFNSNQAFPIGAKVEISPKGFTLGVKAKFNSNQAFPIGAKVENQPQGLYTRSQIY
jgi:hypothetical protein